MPPWPFGLGGFLFYKAQGGPRIYGAYLQFHRGTYYTMSLCLYLVAPRGVEPRSRDYRSRALPIELQSETPGMLPVLRLVYTRQTPPWVSERIGAPKKGNRTPTSTVLPTNPPQQVHQNHDQSDIHCVYLNCANPLNIPRRLACLRITGRDAQEAR